MDKCRNCGASEGIHHYQTLQCPVGGCEAPIGRKQEWMDCRYEVKPQESSEVETLHAQLAKWKSAVEGLTPGGSEFADDPEACERFIRDRQNYPKQIIDLRAQLATMRAALDAAPVQTDYSEDGIKRYAYRCDKWQIETCTPALAGTAAPKTAANVAALVGVIKSLMWDYGGAMSGDEIRLMAVAVGGSSDTVKPVMELSHRVDAAHAKARAALAQFEAGKAGEE